METPQTEIVLVHATDEYISFAKTTYKNPYDCPLLLELEDIYGYMLTYKRPFNKGDVGYLIRKKKKLHANKCLNCYRLSENRDQQPDHLMHDHSFRVYNVEESKRLRKHVWDVLWTKKPLTCEGCRALKLKQAINKEIKVTRMGFYRDKLYKEYAESQKR